MIFILIYYFLMAACVWFVMLSYSWFVSFQALGQFTTFDISIRLNVTEVSPFILQVKYAKR